ncbi:DEK protein [Spatholobus suberectus]|nr:DEK protein [Spatholobus suberectus]
MIGKGKSNKKAKAEPTKQDMHAVVVDILKEVDFNTATLSDILRQLGTHFGLDLMHRKAEVKDIITDVINNMSDEEDEGEEAENDGDADKDDDDDDDDA